jgi:peptide/nickel transport system substrate-binding protein
VRVLTDASDALSLSGIDAIAAAYRILEPPLIPVGSGPWQVVSIDPGASMQLEAFEGFYRGTAATARLDVELFGTNPEAIEAVRSGAVAWLLQPFGSAAGLVAEGIGDAPGLAWAEYSRLAYAGLHYNMRPGRLFADPNLREAVELCIDKDETVATATGDEGISVYSPISPSLWAYETDLPRPTRDTDRAQELIEESGWTLGEDGIYRKGDLRLTTTVPVLEIRPENIDFLELLAFQVADCGMEIVPQPLSRDDLFEALTWPLVPPGAAEPWDAVFTGWVTTPDPDVLPIFHSSMIATMSNPEGNNYFGYDSRESDAVLEAARATYDTRARARLYEQFQRILAEDRPVLFAWSERIREPRSARLESTSGPLATTTGTWWWELEKLFLRPPGQ